MTVTYAACVGEEACYAIAGVPSALERDKDGGGAGRGRLQARTTNSFWPADKNGDSKLSRTGSWASSSRTSPFDTNKDGLLDAEELKAIPDWLNHHHQPGVPAPKKK